MTEEQILKALCDCEGVDGISYCNSCPLYEEGNCVHILSKEAKDLIYRQRAEIERLKTMNSELRIGLKVIKKTEIKRFWEKLKNRNTTMDKRIISVESGDNLVKEMESDKNV